LRHALCVGIYQHSKGDLPEDPRWSVWCQQWG